MKLKKAIEIVVLYAKALLEDVTCYSDTWLIVIFVKDSVKDSHLAWMSTNVLNVIMSPKTKVDLFDTMDLFTKWCKHGSKKWAFMDSMMLIRLQNQNKHKGHITKPCH